MVLQDRDIEFIRENIRYIFGKCEAYIFGSSLKGVRGGDIDIFIISPQNLKFNLFWLKKSLEKF